MVISAPHSTTTCINHHQLRCRLGRTLSIREQESAFVLSAIQAWSGGRGGWYLQLQYFVLFLLALFNLIRAVLSIQD